MSTETETNPNLPKSTYWLSEKLGITYPIIMAPMFLVTDVKMMVAALNSGITAAIPAANARTPEILRTLIRDIKSKSSKPFGINIITNKSNMYQSEQLRVCCEEKVSFFITSLGSPEEVIKQAHAVGSLVFCDVTEDKFAKKVADLGADAVIAVNSKAGGHAGNLTKQQLFDSISKVTNIPIISAGGVGDSEGYHSTLSIGFAGLSIGSIFIASDEAPVSLGYKEACVEYNAKDIVMTTKLSGTPCTVINTPYVQKVGTEQNWLERFLSKRKRLKKWMKAFTFLKGMKKLEKAAFSSTYQTVWCAGPSIEFVDSVLPIQKIVKKLTETSK